MTILSILVPTANRERYVLPLIQGILEFNRQDFELVIQDGAKSDQLKEYCTKINDSRLRYYRSQNTKIHIENFNEGFANCVGDYVSLIGDDDFLTEDIFTIIDFMSSNSIDGYSNVADTSYLWDDVDPKLYDQPPGTLRFLEPAAYKASIANPEKYLKKLLQQGCMGYSNFPLPDVYHGVVKRSVLLRVKERTGQFVHGLSPDIFTSVSAAFFCNRVLVTDYPVIFKGRGAIADRTQRTNPDYGRTHMDNAPHLKNRPDYLWEKMVPNIFTGQAIWAETAMKALIMSGYKGAISEFNLQFFSVVNMYHYRNYFVWASLLHDNFSKSNKKIFVLLELIVAAFKFGIPKLLARFFSVVLKLKGQKNVITLNSLPTVREAIRACSVISEKKLSIELEKLDPINIR